MEQFKQQEALISEEEVFNLMNDEQLISFIVTTRESVIASETIEEAQELRRKARLATEIFDRKYPYTGPIDE